MQNSIKKGWLIIVLVLFLAPIQLIGQKADTLNVLFVGNSFTYFFNLPQVVSAMAKSKGLYINTRQSTVGGSNLEQHWKSEKGTLTRKKLEERKWDYVVFNNHSLSTIDRPEEFKDYGLKFAKLVKSMGGKPVFMMTWAYKSNPLMQPAITKGYYELSKESNSDYVPAGPLFAEVRKWRPDIELFYDDKHPSAEGTYLLGLAFFKYFTKTSTTGIPKRLTTKDINGEKLYLMFIKQEEANFLQNLVNSYDFDINQSNND